MSIIIKNEDCFRTMKDMEKLNKKVNLILTSPPYNTGKPLTGDKSRGNWEGRYDIYTDKMSQDDYCKWCVDVFNMYDSVLKKDGVILWNMSYGSDSSVNKVGIGLMWLAIADIIRDTPFMVADRIIWKKKSALPNNVSPNKLTRIVEDVFVFCRKDEYKTFKTNKQVKSVDAKGQKRYENLFNFVEAKNNDGANRLNKATFSSDLCLKLFDIYIPKDENIWVYDSFAGTCTTAVACKEYGVNCVCSELSAEQCEYGRKRVGLDEV